MKTWQNKPSWPHRGVTGCISGRSVILSFSALYSCNNYSRLVLLITFWPAEITSFKRPLISLSCTNNLWFLCLLLLFFSNRKTMYTRRPCRHLSIPSPAPHPTILRCGRPPHPPIVTSVKVCCGASPGRACAVQSAGSKFMRNAKSCWTLTACKVSQVTKLFDGVWSTSNPKKTNLLELCMY